jgi:hypothetical protein
MTCFWPRGALAPLSPPWPPLDKICFFVTNHFAFYTYASTMDRLPVNPNFGKKRADPLLRERHLVMELWKLNVQISWRRRGMTGLQNSLAWFWDFLLEWVLGSPKVQKWPKTMKNGGFVDMERHLWVVRQIRSQLWKFQVRPYHWEFFQIFAAANDRKRGSLGSVFKIS